ncbi:MAG: hypothetical protein R8M38_00170 [Mariprofundaceae bacterium]
MDQMFLKTPGTSISTIEILNLANQQGIPTLRVDAGKVVTVPQKRIAHNTWNISYLFRTLSRSDD